MHNKLNFFHKKAPGLQINFRQIAQALFVLLATQGSKVMAELVMNLWGAPVNGTDLCSGNALMCTQGYLAPANDTFLPERDVQFALTNNHVCGNRFYALFIQCFNLQIVGDLLHNLMDKINATAPGQFCETVSDICTTSARLMHAPVALCTQFQSDTQHIITSCKDTVSSLLDAQQEKEGKLALTVIFSVMGGVVFLGISGTLIFILCEKRRHAARARQHEELELRQREQIRNNQPQPRQVRLHHYNNNRPERAPNNDVEAGHARQCN